MDEEQKKKMQAIYMQYAIINAALETREPVTESILNEAIAKISTGDSKAGSIGIGKSIASKVGVGITVSDILTKRDRDKYKDTKGQLDLNIKDVNLAEIERAIQNINNSVATDSSNSKNAKDEVASDVNVENLKVIQLTARELFQPTTNKEGSTTDDKSSLKLKWDKELSTVYAGFTNLMTIKMVDIRETDFQSRLDSDDKIVKKGKAGAGALGFQKKIGETITALGGLIETKELKLSELSGGWAYYCFNYKEINYMSSMAPVNGTKTRGSGYYLYMITRTFSKIDVPAHTIDDTDADFSKNFKAINIGGVAIPAGKIKNVFFMVSKGANFPTGTSTGRKNKTFVLNYITDGDGRDGKFYLCKPKNERFNNCTLLSDALSNETFPFADYTALIETNSCHKFTDDVSSWDNEFKLIRSGFKSCEFTHESSIPDGIKSKLNDDLATLALKLKP